MKKIIFLLALLTTLSFAQMNEYKVDLYYSTDPVIFNDEKVAEHLWANQVNSLVTNYDPTIIDRIGNTQVAYHVAEEFMSQMVAGLQGAEGFEAYVQWAGFKALIGNVVKAYINAGFYNSELSISKGFALSKLIEYGVELVGDSIITFIHMPIYVDQMVEFTSSIIDGRGVVVVSHGYGNVFTNKVYNELENTGDGNNVGWMLKYFDGIGVATLKRHDVNTEPEIIFDNDIIMNETFITWLGLEGYSPFFNVNKLINPNRHSFFTNVDGEYGQTSDLKSLEYHRFEYYLGYPVYEEALTDEDNTTSEIKPRQTNIAKDLIQQYLHDEIMAHQSRDSQWQYDTNSSDSKVFLKHRYDDSLKIYALTGEDGEVYPFNMSKGKVYRLDDHITYVKALYGGTSIDANWTGQQPNEIYRLNNPEEEKVLTDRFKSDGSTVIDTETYLAWSNIDLEQHNWSKANDICAKLTLANYNNWRMPDAYELKSIITPDTTTHTYEEFFTNLALKPYGYWSSTTFTYWTYWGYVTDSLVLNYANASFIWIDTQYDMNLMCVQQL